MDFGLDIERGKNPFSLHGRHIYRLVAGYYYYAILLFVAAKVKRKSSDAERLAELHKRFRELRDAKDRWRQLREEAEKLPHLGKKQFLIDPGCDAPPGTCRRCEEWSAAHVNHVKSVDAFNRVSRELSAFTEAVRMRRGRELRVAKTRKGAVSREETLAAVLNAFGYRTEMPSGRLIRNLKWKLHIEERQLRRHLGHPDLLAALEKAGKKLI
jgi:hypothetical protein